VGGIVRVKSAGQMREVVTPFTAANSMGIVEYYDTVREQRTGNTRYNQGLDADSLNKTATGISNIMAAAGQRMEMFARQYAEQFLKPLFLKILELVCKNPDQKEVMRLRNEWVEIDPRSWTTEFDMSVTVGLGSGSREKMVVELTNLLAIDEKIIALQGGPVGPLVDMEKIYGKLERIVEAMGLKGIENFYNDPTKQEQPPTQPPSDPQADKAQIDAQVKMQIAQLDSQTKIEVAKINGEVELLKARMAVPPALNAPSFGEGMGRDETAMHEGMETPAFEAVEPMMEPGEYGV